MHAPTVLGLHRAEGQVGIESRGDTIRLLLATDQPAPTGEYWLPGMLDIGEAGTLLGVEIDLSSAPSLHFPSVDAVPAVEHHAEAGTCYVELTKAAQSGHVRSVPVTVRVLSADQDILVVVEVPRRGHGYEISYPSGNR